jgi:hypothetical protein
MCNSLPKGCATPLAWAAGHFDERTTRTQLARLGRLDTTKESRYRTNPVLGLHISDKRVNRTLTSILPRCPLALTCVLS